MLSLPSCKSINNALILRLFCAYMTSGIMLKKSNLEGFCFTCKSDFEEVARLQVAGRYGRGSDALSTRSAVSNPRVLITCMENSACTMFALFMCELLNASICFDDFGPLERVSVYGPSKFRQKMMTRNSLVFKNTFNSFSSQPYPDDQQWLAIEASFTHRILWFRDPVQNYQSIIYKMWCNDGGGLRAKFKTMDLAFNSFYKHQLVPYYDLVLFEEDFFEPSVLSRLLSKAGMPTSSEQVADAYYLRRMLTQRSRNSYYLAGNFRPPIRKQKSRNATCESIMYAQRYAPNLYSHYSTTVKNYTCLTGSSNEGSYCR